MVLAGIVDCVRPRDHAICACHQSVVLTHDLDFGDILAATGGAKPSVVQIRASGLGVERIGQQVIAALALCAEELDAGALVTVDATRTRVRLLPLPFRHPL